MAETAGDGAAFPARGAGPPLKVGPAWPRPGRSGTSRERPAYLVGIHQAARRAIKEGVRAISAIEFGVAGGNGLLAIEREAGAVEAELGVSIRVFGFDNGPAGLPAFIGDHRDHPDKWRPGDFPMDEARLRAEARPEDDPA